MAIQQQRYAVEVFAEAMVLRGTVTSGLRLSDILNESAMFVTLEQVSVEPFQQDALMGLERHSQGLVNKAAMVLVAELERVGETRVVERAEVGGVHVEKVPHRILMYTDQAAINADIHLAPGADLDTYLAQVVSRFIPVTNATVTPIMPGTAMKSFRRDFMLVNRDHINYVGAESQVAATPAAAAVGGDSGGSPELIG